jgi:hypothetical protein
MDDILAKVATAIREEIVRQYRDDDRRKCPAGQAFWEEQIQPMLLATVAAKAMQAPSLEMVRLGETAGYQAIGHALSQIEGRKFADASYRAMVEKIVDGPHPRSP